MKSNRLLITGFEDLSKYSANSTRIIHKNIARNHRLAKAYGWDIFHMDNHTGVNGTSHFLSDDFPLAKSVIFSEKSGWAERSDFARLYAMLERENDGYGVFSWLDADVFLLKPKLFFERSYAEGLYAPKEPWFKQSLIEESETFVPVKQEQANGVLVASGAKGMRMIALMLEVMKFIGEYGDPEVRPWAQFGPKILTRLNAMDYTTINDGKGPQRRERILSVYSDIGSLLTNTISINKYIKRHGFPQALQSTNMNDCNFVNMTPSSVEDISMIYEQLLEISS